MSYNFSNTRILIVDDNRPMVSITSSILRTFGFTQIETALDADAGYQQFVIGRPDIVLTDWLLDESDGVQLAKRMRTDPTSANPYVPIILMTGFSERARVLEARDAGITEFLVKPFTAQDLYKRLVQVIERPRQFVRADIFFGPDRRRRREEWSGPHRRDDDPLTLKARLERNRNKSGDTDKMQHNGSIIIDFI